MPCTVKKQEATREQLAGAAGNPGVAGSPDTDIVVTTAESRTLFDELGFDPAEWAALPDEGEAGEFASLGGGSGAGQVKKMTAGPVGTRSRKSDTH
eukprot:3433938-Pyramimonas_sp.AAC.1